MNVAPSRPPVLTAKANGVLTITLNRPESRNPLSESLMRALQLALDGAVEDGDVKIVVLAAKGPAFCAGHDLKELTARRSDPDKGLAYYREVFAHCSRLMQTIVRHPKPVIAQVQGVATAAGCQLVASCDLAVASTDARFATPGVNIGLFCSTPMVALSRVVPRKAALEMLYTGEPIDAHEARRIGLVNRVVAPADLEKETDTLARYLANKPTATLKSAAPAAGDPCAEAGGGAGGDERMTSFALALLFAFLGGLILNAMPCVLPVLSLKVLGLVEQSQETPQVIWRHGLIYTAGVLASFLVFAIALIALQQSSWAFQFQDPTFVAIFTAVVFVCLNLLVDVLYAFLDPHIRYE